MAGSDVIAAVAAFAAGAGVLAQNPPAKQSVWDGVYTEAQAARGERQYGRSCEQCHGPDMSGDQVEEIPSLVLDSFMTRLERQVRQGTVRNREAFDAEGQARQPRHGAYVDLIAYLLQANKFPSGAKELSRTPEQLEPIVIERGKTP